MVAKSMVSTGTAAKMLKLHPDTVRKHAKAGKVPGAVQVRGKWMFDPSKLGGKSSGSPASTKKNVTEVYFCLDRSGSMSHLYEQAKTNLNKYVEELRKAVDSNNEYYITIINFDDTVDVTLQSESAARLWNAGAHYKRPGGSTRLFDAIKKAIDLSVQTDDGEKAFLIYALTDGYENASSIRDFQLKSEIQAATAKDRYTFTLAGPSGVGPVATRLGIPQGNVTSWEQTFEGLRTLGMQTNSSIATYAATRSTGVTKSASFYANVTQPAGQFANQLDDKLDDVSNKVDVKRVETSDPVVIRDFCNKKFGQFEKGQIFYQLTESEKVQDYKRVIVQDTATGNFYLGWKAAMKLLGIPSFQGTVRIKPGSLGEFKVFVQSTSVNRKLVPGTAVVRLP